MKTRFQLLTAWRREYLANAKVRLYNSPNPYSDRLTSMKTRKPPISDVAIGSSSVISCHLVNLAYYHGARMKWDPEQHTFVRSSAAATPNGSPASIAASGKCDE